MLLASENIGVGDTRRVVVSYDGFLEKGEIIESVTATIAVTTPAAASTIGTGPLAPARSVNDKSITFYIVGAPNPEKCTVDIQVTTSLSQILNDTIQFSVING